MAYQIHRNSMEHLELYDLDKLAILSSANNQLSPPIPAPRKHRRHLPSTSSTFERYQFLCDMTRHKIDPVYAATPIFTTIPQLIHVNHRRRLLGCRIPAEIIKPLPNNSPNSSKSKNAETNNDSEEEKEEKEKEEEEDEEKHSDEDNDLSVRDDDDDDDDGGGEDMNQSNGSSSSSNNDDNDDDDILNDDDDNKGIVEQIFNRDKN